MLLAVLLLDEDGSVSINSLWRKVKLQNWTLILKHHVLL